MEINLASTDYDLPDNLCIMFAPNIKTIEGQDASFDTDLDNHYFDNTATDNICTRSTNPPVN